MNISRSKLTLGLVLVGLSLLSHPFIVRAQGLNNILRNIEQHAPLLQSARANADATKAGIELAKSQYWGNAQVFGQANHYNNAQEVSEKVPNDEDIYRSLDTHSISNWKVSGYLKLVVKNTDSTNKMEVDDLSLFFTKHVNKWFNPFVEAEIFAVPLWNSKKNTNLKDGNFIIERLYNDFQIEETQRLRIGKFLAPMGQWNLVHAAPLVWTVERPLTTTYSFSNYITGFEYGLELDPIRSSRLDIYWQPSNDFDPKPQSSHPRQYDMAGGLSWTLSDDLDSRSSLDFQYAKVKNSPRSRSSASFHKAIYSGNWSLDSQIIYTKISGDRLLKENWDGGAYFQVRYQFNTHWDNYFRVERFHRADNQIFTNSWLIGGRYRYQKFGNINIEFTHHMRIDGGNSILVSYSILFGQ